MRGSTGPPPHTSPRALPPLFDGNAPSASGSAATPSPLDLDDLHGACLSS